MPLGVLGEQFARGIQVRVLANAREDIEHFAPVRFRILDAIGGDQLKPIRPRKIDKCAIQFLLTAQKMPLQFDKNIFPAEDID
jgi:hypothetical protein